MEYFGYSKRNRTELTILIDTTSCPHMKRIDKLLANDLSLMGATRLRCWPPPSLLDE